MFCFAGTVYECSYWLTQLSVCCVKACIDDKLAMVQFLVEHGADIEACDNEGWTALHATASCGFVNIARYAIPLHPAAPYHTTMRYEPA